MKYTCKQCRKEIEERENYYHIYNIGDLCQSCYDIVVKQGKIKKLKTLKEKNDNM